MNILMLSHEFPSVGGGAGRTAYNLAMQYLAKGHQVTLITCAYKGYEINRIEGLKVLTVYGKRKSELENVIGVTFLSFAFFALFKAFAYIRKNKVDLIQSVMTIPAGVIGVFAKKRFKTKLVVSLLGSDVPYHTDLKSVKILKPVIRYIWRNADQVVALSKGTLRTACRTYSKAENDFKVIYSGISMDIKFSELNHYPVSEGINIVTLARLLKLKGVHDVIEALGNLYQNKELDKFNFKVLGTGQELDSLVKMTKTLGIDKQVDFMGFVPDDKLVRELLSSDFFILTSYSEALGMVFIEALACGLPVIGTNVGGIPEIIDEEVGLLVEPGNIKQIEKAILQMTDKYTTYPQNKLLDRAKAFSWEAIADQYLDIYKKAITN
jgi:glycosyltransferase involved in cell wall biosynthesis